MRYSWLSEFFTVSDVNGNNYSVLLLYVGQGLVLHRSAYSSSRCLLLVASSLTHRFTGLRIFFHLYNYRIPQTGCALPATPLYMYGYVKWWILPAHRSLMGWIISGLSLKSSSIDWLEVTTNQSCWRAIVCPLTSAVHECTSIQRFRWWPNTSVSKSSRIIFFWPV